MIQLNYLDHVAIHVKDMEETASWYASVLGMERMVLPEWGEYPIFMVSGKFGVAVFPTTSNLPNEAKLQNAPHINHFAFNVDAANFQVAQERFKTLDIPFRFADHYYFHSIYISDPDGHTVELTTQVKEW